MSSSLLKRFHRKETIKFLEELSTRRAALSEYEPAMESLWKGTILKGCEFENPCIYRGRLNCHGRLFEELKDLIYPKEGFVLRKGRFNVEHESRFYGALGILETTWEVLDRVDTPLRMFTIIKSERLVEAEKLFVIPLGTTYRDFNADAQGADRLAIEYFVRQVRSQISDGDEELYNATISVGRYITNKYIYLEGPRNIVLGYPSIASEYQGTNLVMRPEVYDAQFKPVSAEVCCLVRGPKNILHVFNRAEIDSSGSVKWQFEYAEMIQRVREGRTLGIGDNDILVEAVTGATDKD